MILWDRTAEPPDSGEVLRWRSHAGLSVPAHLEAHAERLRAKYLAFIHELGERVSPALTLEDGFSFWWTTRLAEKSPFKSPGIYTALRLLALEEILLERKPARLELAGGDADLAEALGVLCGNLGIEFALLPGERNAASPASAVPHPLLGLLAFVRYIVSRRPLRRLNRPRWFSGDASIFICSFFMNVDAASSARGEFLSHYWETLPGSLHDAGRRINWLHHYLHGYGYDPRASVASLERFNADAERQGAHSFLESYLSWGVVLRAFGHWLGLCAAAWRLRGIKAAFAPKGSAVNLWPVLREDWRTSLAGRVGALNCLWLELFDAALANIPTQKTGLFLWENQSWEAAFLRAWRKRGHGEITGVAHSTVPYWHLYYFDDPRSKRPSPDRFVVNGPAAARTFARAGLPPAPLVEVEALRYLKLASVAAGPPADGEVRVIILGDVIPESMSSLLSSLEGAVKLLPAGYRFTFKPHPLYAVDLAAYPGLRASLTTEPLERILGRFDVAVAGNSTSAAVDAHEAGLPVAIELNGSELNLSPLRGEPGARFFGTAPELAAALREASRPARGGFFHLDAGLPRWLELLKLGETP